MALHHFKAALASFVNAQFGRWLLIHEETLDTSLKFHPNTTSFVALQRQEVFHAPSEQRA